MGRKYGNKEEKIMNCFMCKGNLEKKDVNYLVDLDNTIIIINNMCCCRFLHCFTLAVNTHNQFSFLVFKSSSNFSLFGKYAVII